MTPRPEDDLLAEVRLADAEARGRAHPKTFEVPPGDERATLRRGDLAQLCFDDRERMWVEVTRVQGEGSQTVYWGRLRNIPVSVPLRFGQGVTFEPRNVLRVERAGSHS